MKKAKNRRWIKRKLFTYQFKGRAARGLLHRKGVYREWFEYAKLAQARGIKVHRAFGNLQKWEFEDWWRDERYGFELFCEKEQQLVTQVDKAGKLKEGEVLLKINVNSDADLLKAEMLRVLRDLTEHHEYQTTARFKIKTEAKQIKLAKLREARETFMLTEQMKHRRAIRRLETRVEKYDRETGESYFTSQKWLQGYLKLETARRKNGRLRWATSGESTDMKAYRDWEASALRKVARHRAFVLKILNSGCFEQGEFI